MITLFVFITGVLFLLAGAEVFVQSSSSLARRFRVSPLVIGLTVVAFGTSAPELIVSIKTALAGQGGIAVGNVVGSNIFNIAVILGVSAMVFPLKVHIKLIKIDTPVMIVLTVLFCLLFWDQKFERIEGIFFIVLLIAYLSFNIFMARKSSNDQNLVETDLTFWAKFFKNIYLELIFIITSLAVLVTGAELLVKSSVQIARALGVGESIIGLTIVAAGTSLPELATSVVAALRKKTDIAIGNIVGSNIFNIIGILGISATISPIRVNDMNFVNAGVMLLLSLAVLPIMRTGLSINRIEGFLLVSSYCVYLVFLF